MNQLVMERTAQRPTAAAGPRRGPAAPAIAGRSHEIRSVVAVAAGVLAILLLATWSFAQGWGRGPVVGPGELAVDGGIARVNGVISGASPQQAMPGMGTDDAPVAEGMRRVSVDLTLQAGIEEVSYAGDRFTLVVDGEPADRRADRDILPGDLLPPGTQLSGTIVFDVPIEATSGTLSYDGDRGTAVVLPAGDAPAATTAPEGAGTDAPATDTHDVLPGEGAADEH